MKNITKLLFLSIVADENKQCGHRETIKEGYNKTIPIG